MTNSNLIARTAPDNKHTRQLAGRRAAICNVQAVLWVALFTKTRTISLSSITTGLAIYICIGQFKNSRSVTPSVYIITSTTDVIFIQLF